MSVATGLRATLRERARRSVQDRPGRDWTGLVLTAVLLVALAIVSRVLYRFAQLDEGAYRSFSISLSALRTPGLLLTVVAPAGVAVWMRRSLRWPDIPDGRLVRVVVLAAAGSLAVHLCLYEPNWFFDQSHLVDRVLLVALAVVAWWRPIALLPFTVLGAVITSQFAVPLGRYTWNDKRLVFDVLLLFSIAAGVGLLRRRRGLRAFVGGTGILVASWYLVAGMGKVALLWPGREDLSNMTRSAHLAGWLTDGTASRLAEVVAGLNGVLVPLAIAVEVAAVLLLANRRSALAVLIATQGLHLIVFLLSGIFFWKWMILEAALIVFFARCHRDTLAGLGPGLVLLALPFAVLSPRLFGVATLAWYDTPYSVNIEFEAVGASGAGYRLDPRDLAPYDVLFTQGRFGFLAKPDILVGSIGTALDWDVASRLYEARSVSDISEAEADLARSQYDDADAREFDRFIRARMGAWGDPTPLRPPPHIWTGRPPSFMNVPPAIFDGQEAVTEVRVRMHKVWWDGARYQPLADCVVRVVPMAEHAPSSVSPSTACAL